MVERNAGWKTLHSFCSNSREESGELIQPQDKDIPEGRR